MEVEEPPAEMTEEIQQKVCIHTYAITLLIQSVSGLMLRPVKVNMTLDDM